MAKGNGKQFGSGRRQDSGTPQRPGDDNMAKTFVKEGDPCRGCNGEEQVLFMNIRNPSGDGRVERRAFFADYARTQPLGLNCAVARVERIMGDEQSILLESLDWVSGFGGLETGKVQEEIASGFERIETVHIPDQRFDLAVMETRRTRAWAHLQLGYEVLKAVFLILDPHKEEVDGKEPAAEASALQQRILELLQGGRQGVETDDRRFDGLRSAKDLYEKVKSVPERVNARERGLNLVDKACSILEPYKEDVDGASLVERLSNLETRLRTGFNSLVLCEEAEKLHLEAKVLVGNQQRREELKQRFSSGRFSGAFRKSSVPAEPNGSEEPQSDAPTVGSTIDPSLVEKLKALCSSGSEEGEKQELEVVVSTKSPRRRTSRRTTKPESEVEDKS